MKSSNPLISPPQVSIVIVNWNGREWLARCLPSLDRQTYRQFEIIVVDNGSDDGSVEWLADNWPTVRVLGLDDNVGFARANNMAIRATQADFVVTLNNDTLTEPDWLVELIGALSSPDVGMVASRIVLQDRPGELDSAGIDLDLAGMAWNRGWGQDVESQSEPRDVFGPSAAAALYRRSMLEEIGLFDEDYFAYYEDVDLAWRAQRAGWRCRYEPAARVSHRHSATGSKIPRLKARLLGRNKLWTILKNYDWPLLLLALPVIALYDLLAIAYGLYRDRSLAALLGRVEAFSSFGQIRAKRIAGRRVPLSAPPLPWRAAAIANDVRKTKLRSQTAR